MPVLTILGLASLGVSIYMFYKVRERTKYNAEMERKNKELEKTNQQLVDKQNLLFKQYGVLKQKHDDLECHIDELQQQQIKEYEKLRRMENETISTHQDAAAHYFDALEQVYESKEIEFDAKTKALHSQYQQRLDTEKQQFKTAYENYVDNLEDAYTQAECNFDTQLNKIKAVLKEHQEDLEKIRRTYAAAREAQIRDEEIAQQAEFYSLHTTESEKATIALIEELKPRIPDARVLCMLIWQTFFQKKMTTLCNRIIGTNTVSGIYKITNKKNGLCYIGQSVDVSNRLKEHVKCALGIDTPAQNKLYQAMMNDGVTNFTFELLEKCEKNLLNEKEKFYIELYQAYEFGYNSNRGNK
jgi:hypothetical protein